MTIETIRAVLGWCSIINIGILLWWFFAITVLHDFVYKFHSKFLKLSVERFDEIHYAGAMFFKIAVFMFNIVPYFALRIIG
ncbi:DUF6868 family protein [Candidatus Omnitrophota bacterium]